jgi:hypothetical protein
MFPHPTETTPRPWPRICRARTTNRSLTGRRWSMTSLCHRDKTRRTTPAVVTLGKWKVGCDTGSDRGLRGEREIAMGR